MIEKIFIIHNPKLIERKKYLDENINKFGLNGITEYVFNIDKNCLTDDNLFNYSCSAESISYHNRKNVMNIPNESIKKLNNMEIAITLEHFNCYKMLLEDKNHEHCLILEDDVIFLTDDFTQELNKYIEQIDNNYPYILYIGKGRNEISCVNEGNKNTVFKKMSDNIYLNTEKYSQYSDSYLINKKACEIILEHCIPFYFAIDWELFYLHKSTKVKSLFSYPQLTIQGSGYNYSSSNN